MKSFSKIAFLLSGLLLILCVTASAQPTPAEPDDEFNLFLFALAAIFICGMIGAAIVGAMVAALILFFIFGLIGIGVLSASVAVALYKRSYSAGFKSFLILLFGGSCAAIGGIGSYLITYFFNISVSAPYATLLGSLGGLIGGVLMGIVTFRVIRLVLRFINQKLKLLPQ
jgi:predicted lipid-binding transport protein (Tim44 family)